MNLVLAALSGAGWLLSRLGLAALILLAVVLALALAALLIPFCVEVSWEGEAGDPDALGRLTVRAGALGLTLPVFAYPKPAPPPAGQPPAKPGLCGRLRAWLKAKWAAWRDKRRQKRAAKAAARRPKAAPAKPREKANLTLDTLRSILRGAGRLTRAVFGALRVTRIRLFWPVTGPEPAEAARAYGKANAWLYPVLGALSHFVYLDFDELRLVPCIDPDAPVPAARVSFRVSARALFIVIAVVRVLIQFYREKVLDVFL